MKPKHWHGLGPGTQLIHCIRGRIEDFRNLETKLLRRMRWLAKAGVQISHTAIACDMKRSLKVIVIPMAGQQQKHP
ncbi:MULTISPECIES: hypothetical protein [unclassified Mesorhizobium]|uniref:hypothetical protein n=1 Tax=unclassified Mesorhizobium TaxID=325217 RepID=UPI00333A2A7F